MGQYESRGRMEGIRMEGQAEEGRRDGHEGTGGRDTKGREGWSGWKERTRRGHDTNEHTERNAKQPTKTKTERGRGKYVPTGCTEMRSHCTHPPILARVHLHHPHLRTDAGGALAHSPLHPPYPQRSHIHSRTPTPVGSHSAKEDERKGTTRKQATRHERVSRRWSTCGSDEVPGTERMRRDREEPGIAEGTSSASVPRHREEAGGTHERRGHANGERVWTARCSQHRRGVLGLQLREKHRSLSTGRREALRPLGPVLAGPWVSKQTSNDEEREAGRNEHKDWNGRSSNGKGRTYRTNQPTARRCRGHAATYTDRRRRRRARFRSSTTVADSDGHDSRRRRETDLRLHAGEDTRGVVLTLVCYVPIADN
ncbi:hypothetical protein IMY05_C0191000100 [Salix suchowensis]|nr:hypothetical protein IMY05_C0191000100 [Salix suchowensis]